MNGTADAVVLRDAGPEDVPALAELHVRTFRETHGGGPDAAFREKQWAAKLEAGQLVFCLLLDVPSRGLIGFASGKRHAEDGLDYRGELEKIYLLREHHRRGLGRRLLCAAAARFLSAGIPSMLLFGDAASSSNGFYEAMGGKRLNSATGEFHGGYGWSDLARLEARCRE